MDNLTHGLVGLLVSEAFCDLRQRGASRTLRAAAAFVSIVANNLPDADFLYAGITEPPLGYLLHHRGHTHTFVAAPALLLFTLGLLKLLSTLRGWELARLDWLWLAVLGLIGHGLHIALDFTNNYGVHPLWPLYGGWFYGDSVFIVEPWLWLVLLSTLLYHFTSRWARAGFALALLIVIALCFRVSLVPLSSASALLVTAIVLSYGFYRHRIPFQPWLGLLAAGAVIATFAVCGRLAKAAIPSAVAGTLTHDVVTTPLPATPWCWSAWVVQTQDDLYRVQHAVVTPFPKLFSLSSCALRFEDQRATAPLTRVAGSTPDGRVLFTHQFRAPLAELRALARTNCRVSALLRFARIPYWVFKSERLIAGDLRYDRSPGLDFADLESPRSTNLCPAYIPGWEAPRAELLRLP